jgi:glycerol-1-phosphate dehydrogenase [NAD(P)+]
LRRRRQEICDRWEDIRRAIAPIVIAAETSRHHLRAAGAAFVAAELGISAQELSFSYLNARWIRNRYTVLDLAADLGMLEKWQDEVLGFAQGL